MNAEYFLMRQFVTAYLRNSNIEPNLKISDFQEALVTCIIWNKISKKHRYKKYFTTTQAPTHTNTPTEWLSSMNIMYSGVSEFWGFYVSKVPFSSTNT
jgi:hypothetical protein